jgi:uncharacterized membrane protein
MYDARSAPWGKEAFHMRMKPLDRVLCLRAALVGIGAFLFALRLASTPLRTLLGWALPVGIVCLLVASPPPRSSPGVAAGARVRSATLLQQ